MANDYFQDDGNPAQGAAVDANPLLTLFANIELGFDKLPGLTGNGSKVVAVNAGGTALEAITTTGTGNGVRATSPTLTTPTINSAASVGGAWTAAATWTLPDFTLGGTVTLNGKSFSGTCANGGTFTTIDINGGTVDGTAIGGASASSGAFTTLSATDLSTAGNVVCAGHASGRNYVFKQSTADAWSGVATNGTQFGSLTNTSSDYYWSCRNNAGGIVIGARGDGLLSASSFSVTGAISSSSTSSGAMTITAAGASSISAAILRNTTAGQVSPGVMFWNGDGYRHYIQEGAGSAGLNIVSVDGAPINVTGNLTTSGTFTSTGHVGIGTAASSATSLSALESGTDSDAYGSIGTATSDITASSTKYIVGIAGTAYQNPNTATIGANNSGYLKGVDSTSFVRKNAGTLSNLYGFSTAYGNYGAAGADVAATITNAYGVSLNAYNRASATITNLFGFHSGTVPAEGTITNAYACYLNYASGANRWNIYAAGTAANYFSGDVKIHGAGGLGYGTGSGGAVTQATSRTTAVTLNKSNGAITLVSAAGTTAWQTFTVTNSVVEATDVIIVNQKSGTDLHEIHVTAVAAGSFNITFRTTSGTTTEQPVFNFAVIKAVAA